MSMEKTIRKDVPIALYYQLKEELRRKILSGEWKEGSKLPSEKDICEIFGVSRTTVRKAVDELEAEGYLVKKQGRGTFVKQKSIAQNLHKFYSFSEELKGLGIKETAKMVIFKEILPEAYIKKALQLSAEERVFWIKRVRYMDEQAYTVENSYIPVKYAPDMTAELVETNGLYKTLNLFQVYPEKAVENFSAVNLSQEDARAMKLKPGEAAIYLTRTTYSGVNIIEYCHSVVRGDVFQYTVELK